MTHFFPFCVFHLFCFSMHGFLPHALMYIIFFPYILNFLLNFNFHVQLTGAFLCLGFTFLCVLLIQVVVFYSFFLQVFSQVLHTISSLVYVCCALLLLPLLSINRLAALRELVYSSWSTQTILFSRYFGHSLVFALPSSMKISLSSGEHAKTILLNTFSSPFSFPVILKFHLSRFWKETTKTTD